MDEHETKAALVLMEAGTRWPSYAREVRGRASSAVVEAQQPSEELSEFSNRVIARLRRLEQRRIAIPVAIMAVTERTDPQARAVRYRTARAILSAMAPAGDGELVILADEPDQDDVRHELVAFAGALCDGLAGSGLNVRVCFTAAASGIRPLASAARSAAEPRVARESYA